MAEFAPDTQPETVADCWRAARYRSVVWPGAKPGATLKDAPPATGAVFLEQQTALTSDELREVTHAAAQAFHAGGSFVILATSRHVRDTAKAAIVAVCLPIVTGGAAQ